MMNPRTRLQPHHFLLYLFPGLQLIIFTAVCASPPEYVLSGQARALSEKVLATTPAGEISALDVAMFNVMSSPLFGMVPIDVLLEPETLRADIYKHDIKGVILDIVVMDSLARPMDSTFDPDRLRAMTYGAAQAVWVESVIQPDVVVHLADIHRYYLAHPELFLQRREATVRYIFIEVRDTSKPGRRRQAREKLEKIAREIRLNEVKFEEAALQYSDAESASGGGLIPPFLNGTYFQQFEDAAFQLDQPGQISPVFPGPGGYYLIQQVSTSPPRNVAIEMVSGEIHRRLTREHVRHFYAHRLGKIREETIVHDRSPLWEYISFTAPIAEFDSRVLSRKMFHELYGNMIGADYTVNRAAVIRQVGGWIEGEMIISELAEQGLDSHPWIERAHELASIRLRAADVLVDRISPDHYESEQAAIRTLEEHGEFREYLRRCRLASIHVEIAVFDQLPEPEQKSMQTQMDNYTDQVRSGRLPGFPDPLDLGDWMDRVRTGSVGIKPGLEELDDTRKTSTPGGLYVTFDDLGWVDLLPGNPLRDVIEERQIGDIIGPKIHSPIPLPSMLFYLIIDSEPIPYEDISREPLSLQTLALNAEIDLQIESERDRILGESAIRTYF